MTSRRWWLAVLSMSLLVPAIACASPPEIGAPPSLTPFGILNAATRTSYYTLPPANQASLPKVGSFHQPGGFVHWGGPNDAVDTKGGDHCGVPSEVKQFGVPTIVRVKLSGGRTDWLLASGIVQTARDWRWTGYYRGSWQLWQGADSSKLYILNSNARDIAFEYSRVGCM